MVAIFTVAWLLFASYVARLNVRDLEQRYGDRWTSDEPAAGNVHEDARDRVDAGPFRSTSVRRVRQGFPRSIVARFWVVLALSVAVAGVALWNMVGHFHALTTESNPTEVIPSRARAVAQRRRAAAFWMTTNGALFVVALLARSRVERSASRERRPKERP